MGILLLTNLRVFFFVSFFSFFFFFLFSLSNFFSVTMNYMVLGMLVAMAIAVAGEQKKIFKFMMRLDYKQRLDATNQWNLNNRNYALLIRKLRRDDERYRLVSEIYELDKKQKDLSKQRYKLAMDVYKLTIGVPLDNQVNSTIKSTQLPDTTSPSFKANSM